MQHRDPLSSLLGTWQPASPPAPDFSQGVWQRIRASESAAPDSAAILRFPSKLSLPLAASIAILLASLTGTSAALAINRTQSADRMAAAYVRTIDPLQMTPAHAGDHNHP